MDKVINLVKQNKKYFFLFIFFVLVISILIYIALPNHPSYEEVSEFLEIFNEGGAKTRLYNYFPAKDSRENHIICIREDLDMMSYDCKMTGEAMFERLFETYRLNAQIIGNTARVKFKNQPMEVRLIVFTLDDEILVDVSEYKYTNQRVMYDSLAIFGLK